MIFFCSLLLNLYDFYFTACIVKFALCDNIKYRTSFNLWIAIGEKFAWDTQSRSNVALVRHRRKSIYLLCDPITRMCLDFNIDEKNKHIHYKNISNFCQICEFEKLLQKIQENP